MTNEARWVTLVLILLGLTLGGLLGYALDKVIVHYQPVPPTTITECRLPCMCAKYYNLGTNEWPECMGVGYK